MKDIDKTKEQLIGELIELRSQVAELTQDSKLISSVRSHKDDDLSRDSNEEERLRMIIEALPDVVLTVDREGRY